MSVVGNLMVMLGVNSQGMTSGFRKGAAETKGFKTNIAGLNATLSKFSAKIPVVGRSLSGFTGGVGRLTGALGPVAGVAGLATVGILAVGGAAVGSAVALVRMTRATREQMDDTAKLARQLGVSVEWMQELGYVAKINTSGGIETLQKAMEVFSKRMGEATYKGGSASAAFKQLGMDAKEVAALGPEKAFEKVVAAISKIENKAQRAALIANFFSRSSLDMGNMINMDLIDKGIERAKQLGIILSGSDYAMVEGANDALNELGMLADAAKQKLTVAIAPAFVNISHMLSDMIIDGGGMSKIMDDLVVSAMGFAEGIAAAVDSIFLIIKAATPLNTLIGSIASWIGGDKEEDSGDSITELRAGAYRARKSGFSNTAAVMDFQADYLSTRNKMRSEADSSPLMGESDKDTSKEREAIINSNRTWRDASGELAAKFRAPSVDPTEQMVGSRVAIGGFRGFDAATEQLNSLVSSGALSTEEAKASIDKIEMAYKKLLDDISTASGIGLDHSEYMKAVSSATMAFRDVVKEVESFGFTVDDIREEMKTSTDNYSDKMARFRSWSDTNPEGLTTGDLSKYEEFNRNKMQDSLGYSAILDTPMDGLKAKIEELSGAFDAGIVFADEAETIRDKYVSDYVKEMTEAPEYQATGAAVKGSAAAYSAIAGGNNLERRAQTVRERTLIVMKNVEANTRSNESWTAVGIN